LPSPAPHAKSVAAQANSPVSLKQVNAHSRPKRHSCHYVCPWPSWRVPLETVSTQADSAGPIPVTCSTKSGCSSCSGEELLHCAKAARYTDGSAASGQACGLRRPRHLRQTARRRAGIERNRSSGKPPETGIPCHAHRWALGIEARLRAILGGEEADASFRASTQHLDRPGVCLEVARGHLVRALSSGISA
jgi:hypothetical protein